MARKRCIDYETVDADIRLKMYTDLALAHKHGISRSAVEKRRQLLGIYKFNKKQERKARTTPEMASNPRMRENVENFTKRACARKRENLGLNECQMSVWLQGPAGKDWLRELV